MVTLIKVGKTDECKFKKKCTALAVGGQKYYTNKCTHGNSDTAGYKS